MFTIDNLNDRKEIKTINKKAKLNQIKQQKGIIFKNKNKEYINLKIPNNFSIDILIIYTKQDILRLQIKIYKTNKIFHLSY